MSKCLHTLNVFVLILSGRKISGASGWTPWKQTPADSLSTLPQWEKDRHTVRLAEGNAGCCSAAEEQPRRLGTNYEGSEERTWAAEQRTSAAGEGDQVGSLAMHFDCQCLWWKIILNIYMYKNLSDLKSRFSISRGLSTSKLKWTPPTTNKKWRRHTVLCRRTEVNRPGRSRS